MKKILFIILCFLSLQSFSQITGHSGVGIRLRDSSLTFQGQNYSSNIPNQGLPDWYHLRPVFKEEITSGAGTKVLRYNPTTKKVYYADTTGGTPTLQQVLTAGATLTGDNTIDAATYDFIISDTKAIGNNLIGLNSFGAGLVSDNSPVGLSEMYVASTQIELRPALGNLKIDSLTNAVGIKALRYNPTTGLVSYADTTVGGGGSPAGNFGNVQINRNGAFAAMASDSFTVNSSGQILVPTQTTVATPSIAGFNDTNTGFGIYGSDIAYVTLGGAAKWGFQGAELRADQNGLLSWNNTVNGPFGAGPDLAIGRNAAGVLEVNNGTLGTFRDLKLRHSIFTGRNQQGKGADVAAANDLTLGADGNLFHITGATTINAITTSGWQAGSEITLIFDSTPTVKNNTAGSGGTAVMKLAGGADFSATANDVLRLVYDGTVFYEISRSVN